MRFLTNRQDTRFNVHVTMKHVLLLILAFLLLAVSGLLALEYGDIWLACWPPDGLLFAAAFWDWPYRS